jgi:hypothetical protein
VELLLAAGAPATPDALAFAAENGDVEILTTLLSAGANVNEVALHYGVSNRVYLLVHTYVVAIENFLMFPVTPLACACREIPR